MKKLSKKNQKKWNEGRKLMAGFATVCLLFFMIFPVSCVKAQKPREVVVLAAASLVDVCGELKSIYEKENPSVKVLFSFGGSGALQAQIEAGVPGDMFISASNKQMDALLSKSLVEKESVKTLLQNEVVLITYRESALSDLTFENLTDEKVRMIAIGDPMSVPVGQYTEKICIYLGNWDGVKEKANLAQDVRTVLSWVESQACDCGIVYKTDAASSDKVKVLAAAPENSCPAVLYPAGILSSAKNKSDAYRFEDFLFSKKAAEVFEKYGFTFVNKTQED